MELHVGSRTCPLIFSRKKFHYPFRLLLAVAVFTNNWRNLLLHCNVIIQLHTRVLFKWSTQVFSVFFSFFSCPDGCIFMTLLEIYVLAGTQASWQLEWAFFSFYWLAFLTQGLWILPMFLNTFLLIHTTTLSSRRKNVLPARSLSKLIVLV